MTVDEIVEKIKKYPWSIKMGKGSLAKKWHCNPADIIEAKRIVKEKNKLNNNELHLPRILLFDVETAPMKAYVWRRWKENISLDQTISEWFMICWSAKWLYADNIMGECLTSKEMKKEDDSRIIKKLWDLVNTADIVIAYNGKKADIPWMNTRFILNGLMPPKPYFIIDPCEIARKRFGFSSNKLDALAGYFNIEHKLETSFDLWKNCMEGDEESLKYMLDYNKVDVKILEEVYLRMRPWVPHHPNIANFCDVDNLSCVTCGSTDLQLLEGQFYHTAYKEYQLYRCNDCGTVFRSRKGIDIKTQVKSL